MHEANQPASKPCDVDSITDNLYTQHADAHGILLEVLQRLSDRFSQHPTAAGQSGHGQSIAAGSFSSDEAGPAAAADALRMIRVVSSHCPALESLSHMDQPIDIACKPVDLSAGKRLQCDGPHLHKATLTNRDTSVGSTVSNDESVHENGVARLLASEFGSAMNGCGVQHKSACYSRHHDSDIGSGIEAREPSCAQSQARDLAMNLVKALANKQLSQLGHQASHTISKRQESLNSRNSSAYETAHVQRDACNLVAQLIQALPDQCEDSSWAASTPPHTVANVSGLALHLVADLLNKELPQLPVTAAPRGFMAGKASTVAGSESACDEHLKGRVARDMTCALSGEANSPDGAFFHHCIQSITAPLPMHHQTQGSDCAAAVAPREQHGQIELEFLDLLPQHADAELASLVSSLQLSNFDAE